MSHLLTEKQVAERLFVSLATVRRRRTEGRPTFVKIGSSTRYRMDMEAFTHLSLACNAGAEVTK